MTITKHTDGDKLTIALEGRLDTSTAPELEAELNASLDGVKQLVLDMEQLLYLSSAGLRVVLAAQKRMPCRRRRRICAKTSGEISCAPPCSSVPSMSLATSCTVLFFISVKTPLAPFRQRPHTPPQKGRSPV